MKKRVDGSIKNKIPLCVPHIGKEDLMYIQHALKSNWVSSVGPDVERFESVVARESGRAFAVATVNGTSALHLAFLAMGLGPGDEVLVPTLTFIASINPIRYTGAWPIFMDAEPSFFQMDVAKTAEFLKNNCRRDGRSLINKSSGRRVRAIVPVHILGHPVDMDPLMVLARRYGLTVIEDAAEALGSVYRGRRVGSLGDMGCFSFNGNKIITTGAGGMVVTDNPEWAERIRYYSTQARCSSREDFIHDDIGFNYRLSNLQAVLGLAQMARFTHFLKRKHAIAKSYRESLKNIAGLRCIEDAPWCCSNSWLSAVCLAGEKPIPKLSVVRAHLALRGIESRPLWKPIHRQRPYRRCETYRLEWADWLHDRVLCLPSSVGLTWSDQRRVIASLKESVREAAQ